MTTTTGTDVRSQKSTIVRTFQAPSLVRSAFQLLERTAPGLGARWAEHIWFTLPEVRHSSASSASGASGASGTARASIQPAAAEGSPFSLQVDGHLVAGETWGAGPTVYLVHGWAGNRRQLAGFVAPLVAAGHRVAAFDAPSHGDSAPGAFGPRSSSIPEFAAALSAVVAAHGRPHAIIAHSMGSTATAVALCDGLVANRVAMLAPMASPAAYARQFRSAFGFGERIHRKLVTRVQRRVGAPMHHFDVPDLGRAVAMPPTLVVHDRADTYTPVTDGAAIAAAWPGARLRVTTGLGHNRLLRDPDVIAEVVAFITA
ncbi:MAG TPA: alpha/beta fold hydrolase [Micromonosporaceae bacterium]